MWVQWAGESTKWMMLAIIDESSYRLSVNDADDLHLIAPIAPGLTTTLCLLRHQPKHSDCFDHVVMGISDASSKTKPRLWHRCCGWNASSQSVGATHLQGGGQLLPQPRPTAFASACSIRTYRGSSFEGTCRRNCLSARTVAKAWTCYPF